MRDVQSSECEPHGSIVLVDISNSRFLVIRREETKKLMSYIAILLNEPAGICYFSIMNFAIFINFELF